MDRALGRRGISDAADVIGFVIPDEAGVANIAQHADTFGFEEGFMAVSQRRFSGPDIPQTLCLGIDAFGIRNVLEIKV